jgi:hypothetical protein
MCKTEQSAVSDQHSAVDNADPSHSTFRLPHPLRVAASATAGVAGSAIGSSFVMDGNFP